MKSRAALVILCLMCSGMGAAAWSYWQRARAPAAPTAASVALRLRQVALLTTLHATVYKKISFAPDPKPGESTWQDLWNWLQQIVSKREGKAIVFGKVRATVDLSQLDEDSVRALDHELWVVLPPMDITAEVFPGETEIIGSNLNSEQTAQMLERARDAFRHDAREDPEFLGEAQGATRRAVESLVLKLGFQAVHFVDTMPPLPGVGAG